ncbi:hypothetical protein WJX72_005954 [[Myrmecia] bisecta]|uniref:catechol O-methyltransferase n=1 Tax=[Myrmecia] bisecta TaxID=41462 RepID=A0AAW1PSY8_9CHLO
MRLAQEKQAGPPSGLDSLRKRQLEDELKDPKNFLEFFLPRPLRLLFFGGAAASCFIATLLSAVRFNGDLGYGLPFPRDDAVQVAVNLIGLVTFAGLYYQDNKAAGARLVRRQQLRERQIAFGDREVYTNTEGERMSKLREVDDDWILRRLERWGKKDGMPFVGPAKGKVLQQLVQEAAPKLVVEVGTLCGYSALLIAQALPPEGRLITIEADWKWVLVAKRFLGQAAEGHRKSLDPSKTLGRMDVWWGDAREKLAGWQGEGRIGLLFLDGVPKQSLEYLKAAEPHLAEGAVIIADNAGVFAGGGMKPYLEYVRSNPKFSSRYVESTLGWRDDVLDGLEVTTFLG